MLDLLRMSRGNKNIRKIKWKCSQNVDLCLRFCMINSYVKFSFFSQFLFNCEQLNPEWFAEPVDNVKRFIRKEIVIHRQTYDPENIRDLVDLYLQTEESDFTNEWMDGNNNNNNKLKKKK